MVVGDRSEEDDVAKEEVGVMGMKRMVLQRKWVIKRMKMMVMKIVEFDYVVVGCLMIRVCLYFILLFF